MNKNKIKEVLTERGYSERNANMVATDLSDISAELRPLLEEWMINESAATDYAVQGHSINEFCKNGMKYPAALLTIDWLIKEPEAAKKSLTKGIR